MPTKGRNILIALCSAVLMAALLRGCVVTSYLIPSTGMENTLYQGERIWVNRWSYGYRLPWMRLWGYQRWCEVPVQRDEVVVFNNPANYTTTPLSRREVFIGRCIGTPGDTLLIDSLYTVDSSSRFAPDSKILYRYPHSRVALLDSLLLLLHIPQGRLMGKDSTHCFRSFSRYEHYLLEQAMNGRCWLTPADPQDSAQQLHPLIVPGRHRPVRVYPWNITLLRNTLVLHEGKQAEIRHDTLYVEGKPTQHCTFTKNYYWVCANNSVNLSDSRLFGFVPQDHLIGRATRVWFSKEPESSLFSGYRWHRIGKKIE